MSKYVHRNFGWFEAIVNKHGGEDGADRFLRGETMIIESPKPPQLKLLSVIAMTKLAATPRKKTSACFVGPLWNYRDGDFDHWLGADQVPVDATEIATCAFSRGWLFAEAAADVLKVEPSTDVVTMGNLLIERRHTITLPQSEKMTVRTERSEPTGMRTDGYGNFFFVETGDPKNPVSVGRVRRCRRWDANVHRLGNDFQWNAACRLLVRNLSDTLKL
jgi:hypothetical protein